MDKELTVVIQEQSIAQENAKQLLEAFGAPFTEAGEILANYESIVVTDESQKDLMAEAKTKRLALKKVRTTVENRRKELKEESLRTGKAIDGVARYIRETIEPAENYLELQEKFAEMREAERLSQLKAERTAKVLPYCENPGVYTFMTMSEEEFEELYKSLKEAHELKLAQEKAYAEKLKQEEEAHIAENKRIREENERLRKEAEQRELEAIEERRKREEIEAAQKAESDRIAKEQAAKEEAERSALLAPDKEKLIAFADLIDKIQAPQVANREAGKVLDEAKDFLERISRNLRNKAKEL